jgi:DMSO/TMAO reductase YedYZ molybdopterin-dependent catalytic subunit
MSEAIKQKLTEFKQSLTRSFRWFVFFALRRSLMKAVTENAAFPESYVVEIDGKIESVHRIYIEALKAGMELKQKFAHSHIKVHEAVER